MSNLLRLTGQKVLKFIVVVCLVAFVTYSLQLFQQGPESSPFFRNIDSEISKSTVDLPVNHTTLWLCHHTRGGSRPKWVTPIEFYTSNETCYHILRPNMKFLRLGKGGGGTVSFVSTKEAHMVYQKCHPNPCKIDGNTSLVLVNIRDPVDRFVSAFNWRSFLFCKGGHGRSNSTSDEIEHRSIEQESRIGVSATNSSKGLAIQFPNDYCVEWDEANAEAETYMLQNVYQSNVNTLAESFCKSENDGQAWSDDRSPLRDAKSINHARRSLINWFRAYHHQVKGRKSPSSYQKDLPSLIGITLERLQENDIQFEKRVDRALWVAINNHYDHYVSEKLVYKQGNESRLQGPAPWRYAQVEEDFKAIQHSAHGAHPPAITEYGECCLTRYYLARDYALLNAILSTATKDWEPLKFDLDYHYNVDESLSKICHWGAPDIDERICLASLASMVGRRAKYLMDFSQTCRDIVG